ncbi:MAG: hypothetical protein NZ992_00175 [Candidatus Korarchaeum sp.]|nr:hypothetical protein [Candidatus Korarchaeum sp.]MDW8093337.1 hypothetical protein [Nitrososphaerota archaeon]
MSTNSVVTLLDVLRISSRSAVIVAERGKGKSQLIGTLSYTLWRHGWTIIILDPKASFQYAKFLNLAEPSTASQVREVWGSDLEPPDALFFMPYYAWDFEEALVPDYIEPAPVSIRMIMSNTRAWELLGDGALKPREVDLLMSAYQSTGRESSSPLAMVSLLREWGKLTPRLSDILFSGLIDTKSPLDPDVLLKRAQGKMIILSSPRTVNSSIIAFWYGTFLQALFSSLRDWTDSLDLAVFIDETLVLSHGAKQTTSSWWFSKLLSEFLSQGRQIGKYGNVRTRVFLAAQLATAIDYEIMSLSNLAFISRGILNQEAERKYLKKHFCSSVPAPSVSLNSEPGEFSVFVREGKIGTFKFPISPIFIPREFEAPSEEAYRQKRFIENHVSFRSLTHLFALARKLQSEAEMPKRAPGVLMKINREYLARKYFKSLILVLVLYGLVLADQQLNLRPNDVIDTRTLYNFLARDFNSDKERPALVRYAKKRMSPRVLKNYERRMRELGLLLSPIGDIVVTEDFTYRVLPELRKALTREVVIERIAKSSSSKDAEEAKLEYVESMKGVLFKADIDPLFAPETLEPILDLTLEEETGMGEGREMSEMVGGGDD